MTNPDEVNDLLCFLDEEYAPAIPDDLIEFYLKQSGLVTDDVKAKRLVALATEKFIHDVARSAMHHNLEARSNNPRGDKCVLTQAALALALREYGINVGKPSHYV